MQLKVFRLRHNAKLPKRAHGGDAGMDFYFCPKKGDSNRVVIHLDVDQSLFHNSLMLSLDGFQ